MDESGRACGQCRSSLSAAVIRLLRGDASLEFKHPSTRTIGHLVRSLAETCLEVEGVARFAPDLQRVHLVTSLWDISVGHTGSVFQSRSSLLDHPSWIIGSWTLLSQSHWQCQPCLDSLTSIPCPMEANELIGCLRNSISLLQVHSMSGNRG